MIVNPITLLLIAAFSGGLYLFFGPILKKTRSKKRSIYAGAYDTVTLAQFVGLIIVTISLFAILVHFNRIHKSRIKYEKMEIRYNEIMNLKQMTDNDVLYDKIFDYNTELVKLRNKNSKFFSGQYVDDRIENLKKIR